MKYVIVELLRNVIQHSMDRLGGVVAAQRMDDQDPRALQVAVADAGVGIFEAMHEKHPSLRDHREALEKALWPRISGTFEEGLTGSQQNAGYCIRLLLTGDPEIWIGALRLDPDLRPAVDPYRA